MFENVPLMPGGPAACGGQTVIVCLVSCLGLMPSGLARPLARQLQRQQASLGAFSGLNHSRSALPVSAASAWLMARRRSS